MRRKKCFGFSMAAVLAASLTARGQSPAPSSMPFGNAYGPYIQVQAPMATPPAQAPTSPPPAPEAVSGGGTSAEESRAELTATEEGAAPADPKYGPTPLTDVGILNDLIYGDRAKDAKIKFSAWMDFDYTFRSTGPAENNVAPVENRFGDEFLVRAAWHLHLQAARPEMLVVGFQRYLHRRLGRLVPQPHGRRVEEYRPSVRLGVHRPERDRPLADPDGRRRRHQGRPADDRPGSDGRTALATHFRFERLCLVQPGRRSLHRCLRRSGTLASGWTGTTASSSAGAPSMMTSAPRRSTSPRSIYWLDEEAKKTKVWTTVLTGPTGMFSTGNTTITEVGIQHNWNKYVYQIIDTQIVLLEGADLLRSAAHVPGTSVRRLHVPWHPHQHLSGPEQPV